MRTFVIYSVLAVGSTAGAFADIFWAHGPVWLGVVLCLLGIITGGIAFGVVLEGSR